MLKEFFCSNEGGHCSRAIFLPAGACEVAGSKIDLCFQCLSVCLFACASALMMCAICYIIRYYATAVYSRFWRFVGHAKAKEDSFVLPRCLRTIATNCKHTTKLPSQELRLTVSAGCLF